MSKKNLLSNNLKTPWLADYEETCEYSISYWDEDQTDNIVCGKAIMKIEPFNEDSYNFKINSEYDLSLVSFLKTENQTLHTDNIEVQINRKTNKPIKLKYQANSSALESETTASYGRKKVSIKTISSETGIQDYSLSIQQNTFDNFQALSALRGVNFKRFKEDDISLIVANIGLCAEVTLINLNSEKMITKFGEMECYRLSLSLTYPVEQKVFLSIAKEYPHYLIRYSNGPRTFDLIKVN